MKLLRQTIRRMILQEGMKMPEQLPGNIGVVVDYSLSPIVNVYYAELDKNGDVVTRSGTDPKHQGVWGWVEFSLNTERYKYGPCSGAAVVRETEAADGWGPLLYDVAIEVASAEASGLIADRRTVSPDARYVWNTYLRSRDDVDSFQLDDPYDRLTPDPDDNCNQDVAMEDEDAYDWEESPLSKVYIKNSQPMMDKLDALGKLVELEGYQ